MRIFSFSQSLLNLLLNPPSTVCVRVRVSGNNSIGWLWYVLPLSVCPSACADTSPDSLCVPCAMLHPVHGTQRRSHGAIQGRRLSVLIPKPPAEPVKSSGMRSDWYDGQCVLQRASRRCSRGQNSRQRRTTPAMMCRFLPLRITQINPPTLSSTCSTCSSRLRLAAPL